MYKTLLKYNSDKNIWSEFSFETYQSFLAYVQSQFKFPGQYNLVNTHLFRPNAIKFQKDGKYCDYHPTSKDYKSFWDLEKRKCLEGIIIDNFYVTGDYYWYLNFNPIYSKIDKKEIHAEVWDSDFHFYLYLELCNLLDKNSCVVKKRQCGYAQPNSEVVLCKDGWKKIGDIKVGDLVFTPKGTPTPVLDIFPQGLRDIYEVEFLDGRKVRCDLNHLWQVKHGTGKKQTVSVLSLKELLERKIVGKSAAKTKDGIKEYNAYLYKVLGIDPVQFEKKELKIHPYVLGCLIGDGSTNKPSVQLCSSDQEIFDNVIKYLGEDYEYGSKDKREGNASWRYNIKYKKRFDRENNSSFKNHQFGVNPLKRYLEEYNLHTSDCYSKFIPKDYLFSDFEDRLNLLHGLMDTDGYINSKGYDIHFTTVSEQLANDVAHLARSLGIGAVIDKFKHTNNKNYADYYRVRLKKRFPLFKLKRKLDRQLLCKTKNYFSDTSIVSIKKLDYQEESTCIYIEDEEHLYLTKDFIPTHNTLKHASILLKSLWFEKKTINKIIAYDETHTKGAWSIADGYRNHLNTHTAWYRNFNPDSSLEWKQRVAITEGTSSKKTIFKGNHSVLQGFTTKMNPTKPVGGPGHKLFFEESGINPTLDKSYRYADENIRIGNVKTGMVYVSGAVGELKDCAPLQEFAFNPEGNGFLGIDDVFSDRPHPDKICFFVQELFNFVYVDEHTKQVVRCYDSNGNSDLTEAAKYFDIWYQKQKKSLNERDFKIWSSQHPLTIQEAFEQRDTNPFPISLLQEQEKLLIGEKPIIVSLERDFHGKITHKFCDDVPISKIKPNPNENNKGAIVVYEFPIDKPPFGLYYAGIDPIYNLDTSTSTSLMAISVWIGTHERDGKIVEPYPVCQYIGRHRNVRDTYEQCLKIIEWYNARTAVESNVKDFTEWVIRQGKARFLMRRRELTVINELTPNSTVRDEIGVRMIDPLKTRALEKVIAWLQLPIASSFDMETGESKDVYNVSKIKDSMWIKEMLQYNPKLNTDRLVANLLALLAVQSDTNRHIITGMKNPFKQEPKRLITKLPSTFVTQKTNGHFKKLKSHFG